MTYEHLKLCPAVVSGEIYLARTIQEGVMSSQRRLITEEVLSAAADWFLLNKRNEVKWECIHEGKEPHLFFTTDPKKAKQIIDLLKGV